MTLDPSSKARAFALGKKESKSQSEKLEVIVSYHGNTIMNYSVSAKKNTNEETKESFSVAHTYGTLDCHKQGVRGVTVAAND